MLYHSRWICCVLLHKLTAKMQLFYAYVSEAVILPEQLPLDTLYMMWRKWTSNICWRWTSSTSIDGGVISCGQHQIQWCHEFLCMLTQQQGFVIALCCSTFLHKQCDVEHWFVGNIFVISLLVSMTLKLPTTSCQKWKSVENDSEKFWE